MRVLLQPVFLQLLQHSPECLGRLVLSGLNERLQIVAQVVAQLHHLGIDLLPEQLLALHL